MLQETFRNYLGQQVTQCKSWQHDYHSPYFSANVMIHGQMRARRGKGPSMSLGVIKNPRQALYLAQRLVDTEMCLDSFNEDHDRKKMQDLLLVVTGKKTFTEWQKEMRTQAKSLMPDNQEAVDHSDYE